MAMIVSSQKRIVPSSGYYYSLMKFLIPSTFRDTLGLLIYLYMTINCMHCLTPTSRRVLKASPNFSRTILVLATSVQFAILFRCNKSDVLMRVVSFPRNKDCFFLQGDYLYLYLIKSFMKHIRP